MRKADLALYGGSADDLVDPSECSNRSGATSSGDRTQGDLADGFDGPAPAANARRAFERTDPSAGCDLCARYCPTGALSFTTSGNDETAHWFTLGFRADLCIDCAICVPACPEQAISYGDTLDADALTRPTWSELASGPLIACSACGMLTAPRRDDQTTRCFSCRLGTGIVTALRDDAGLMADLLGRIPPPPNQRP